MDEEVKTKTDKRLLKKLKAFNKWIKHWIGNHKNYFIHLGSIKKKK